MARIRTARQPRQKKQRREQILNAAAEVFFKSGFSGASVDDVIAKVGGSKRTIYSYFGTKDELFAAIVTEISARALAPLARDDTGTCTLEATLREVGRRYLDVIMSPTTLALYRTVVAEGSRFPQLAKAFYEGGPGRVSVCLAAALKKKRTAWHISVKDSERAAEQFLGMLRDHMHLRVILGLRDPPTRREADQAVAQAVAIFLRGCCAGAPAKKAR